jgi:putative membrane protein
MKGRDVMVQRGWVKTIAISAVPFFYAVGLAGHLFQITRPMMLTLTPYFLLIFGLIPLVPLIRESGWGVILWSASTLVITFFLEALGTHSGWVFGPYTYGPTLGIKLLNVPVVIALNWLIVIVAALTLTRSIRNPLLVSLVVGAAAALFDFVMEPVAISLDYWFWHTSKIPLQNYLAWFTIAFLAALVFRLCGLKVGTRIPLIYVMVQFIFFLVLRIALVASV